MVEKMTKLEALAKARAVKKCKSLIKSVKPKGTKPKATKPKATKPKATKPKKQRVYKKMTDTKKSRLVKPQTLNPPLMELVEAPIKRGRGRPRKVA